MSLERRSVWGLALVGSVLGLVAIVWLAMVHKTSGPDAYALATAYASSSPEVQSRVGLVVSTAFAPGESRCVSESAFPPTCDATFTLLVMGSRDHAELDARATKDTQGWHLIDMKLRSTDDAPVAVASSCSSGPGWGPGGNYGRH